jgi:hypothetical protein
MIRKYLVGTLLAAGMAIAVPVAAHAETAEEAVAYTLMGLADGATFERATTKMEWTEAGASPAVFDGAATIGGKPAKIQFTVTAIDACHYEVTLQGPMVPSGGKALYAKVDLTAVGGVTPAADAIHVDVAGDGFCETGRTNPDCMVVNQSDLFGFVDAKRHGELVAFLREDVCPAKE